MFARCFQKIVISLGETLVLTLEKSLVIHAEKVSFVTFDSTLPNGVDFSLEGEQLTLTGKALTVGKLIFTDVNGIDLFIPIDVVQAHYFSLDDLRNYGDDADDLSSASDDDLYLAREAATEIFETAAKRSFVERATAEIVYLHPTTDDIILDHGDITSILSSGFELISDNKVRAMGNTGHTQVRCCYTYGSNKYFAQVRRAVLMLAAYMLRPSNRPMGAIGESTEAGFMRFTVAGQDGATDIPEVNAAIQQFGRGDVLVW